MFSWRVQTTSGRRVQAGATVQLKNARSTPSASRAPSTTVIPRSAARVGSWRSPCASEVDIAGGESRGLASPPMCTLARPGSSELPRNRVYVRAESGPVGIRLVAYRTSIAVSCSAAGTSVKLFCAPPTSTVGVGISRTGELQPHNRHAAASKAPGLCMAGP